MSKNILVDAYNLTKILTSIRKYRKRATSIDMLIEALCQMLGYSPYESSLAPIICMVGAILFAQK